MYFLVWACNMTIPQAESLLESSPDTVRPLSDAGRSHWRECEAALLAFISASSNTSEVQKEK
jgi:hypothetical protein